MFLFADQDDISGFTARSVISVGVLRLASMEPQLVDLCEDPAADNGQQLFRMFVLFMKSVHPEGDYRIKKRIIIDRTFVKNDSNA